MQPFYQNLNHLVRVDSKKLTARYPTGLRDTNDIAILHTDWNGLPLNGRWFLVTDLIDDFEDLWRDRRLVPGP